MCGVHKLTEYFFLPFLQRPSSKIRVLALIEFHFMIDLLLPATSECMGKTFQAAITNT